MREQKTEVTRRQTDGGRHMPQGHTLGEGRVVQERPRSETLSSTADACGAGKPNPAQGSGLPPQAGQVCPWFWNHRIPVQLRQQPLTPQIQSKDTK